MEAPSTVPKLPKLPSVLDSRPEFGELFAFWHSLRNDPRNPVVVPPRAALRISNLLPWAAKITFLQMDPQAFSAKMIFAGIERYESAGQEISGADFNSMLPDKFRTGTSVRILAHPAAYYCRYVSRLGGRVISASTLNLPLTDAEGRPVFILSLADIDDDIPIPPLSDFLGNLVELNFTCIDIGAGVPFEGTQVQT